MSAVDVLANFESMLGWQQTQFVRDAADLIETGNRLTAAFRANGRTKGFSPLDHMECAAAMTAFDAVLARFAGEEE